MQVLGGRNHCPILVASKVDREKGVCRYLGWGGGNRGEAARDAATYYTPGKWQDGQRKKVYRGTREGGGSGGCRSGSGKGIVVVVVVVVDVVIVVVDFIVVVVVDVITDENKNAHFLQASYDICGTTCSLVSSWLSDSACVRPSLTCYRSDMYYLTRVTGKKAYLLTKIVGHTHTLTKPQQLTDHLPLS